MHSSSIRVVTLEVLHVYCTLCKIFSRFTFVLAAVFLLGRVGTGDASLMIYHFLPSNILNFRHTASPIQGMPEPCLEESGLGVSQIDSISRPRTSKIGINSSERKLRIRRSKEQYHDAECPFVKRILLRSIGEIGIILDSI